MFNLISSASFSFPKDTNKTNEDTILPPISLESGFLFAVADGVGSYSGAKEASTAAIGSLRDIKNLSELNTESIMLLIKNKIANLKNKDESFKDAATTLTFGYIDKNGLQIGHIGDSRLYLKKGNNLVQITKDHTRHQKLLEAKLYTAKQLKVLEGKNVLMSALSSNLELNYDEYFLPFEILTDFFDENKNIIINIMTDGAHEPWENRPKFSPNTLNSPLAFSSSLIKRINRINATDDHSLISMQFQYSP